MFWREFIAMRVPWTWSGRVTRPAPDRPIALIGLMGAGKTTVGRLLARCLGREFIDMDAELARELGMTVTRTFAKLGEANFRRRESALLRKLSARRDGPVVATGGGVVLRPSNRTLLASRFETYWLDISAAEAWRRLGTPRGRPLLQEGPGGTPRARLVRLARERRTLHAASGRRLRATGRTPIELAESIAAHVAGVARVRRATTGVDRTARVRRATTGVDRTARVRRATTHAARAANDQEKSR